MAVSSINNAPSFSTAFLQESQQFTASFRFNVLQRIKGLGVQKANWLVDIVFATSLITVMYDLPCNSIWILAVGAQNIPFSFAESAFHSNREYSR